jgi:hypothetical protein
MKFLMLAAVTLALCAAGPAFAEEKKKSETRSYDDVVAACDQAADLEQSCDYAADDDGVINGCFGLDGEGGNSGPCFKCVPDGSRTCQIMRVRFMTGAVRADFEQFLGDFNPQPDPPRQPAGGSLAGGASSASPSTTVIIY